ncbi:MAG: 3'(2'),5'-bisphosphate nucleotidase CysQ [Xanthobacteraceae bacterium]
MPTLDSVACADLMDELTGITAQAAKAILDFAIDAGLRSKADGSPVTAADDAAEAIICDGLKRLAPDLPVISEEHAAREKPKPIVGGSYFLVDPLDGTREFIAGRDEYTINIALMTDGAPLFGIICAPALGDLWRGIVGRGAERLSLASWTNAPTPIRARRRPQSETVVMVSRSHLEARTKSYVDGLSGAKLVQSGSSIKFCRLAEGFADLYPRLAPTHDWDIAAGHAILKAAGGGVTAPDGTPLVYGTTDLLIPAFLAWGDPASAAPVKD